MRAAHAVGLVTHDDAEHGLLVLSRCVLLLRAVNVGHPKLADVSLEEGIGLAAQG